MEVDPSLIRTFMDAAEYNQPLALEMLRDHPELRHAKCLWGKSILDYVAIEGFAAAGEFLAQNGFDVNVPNSHGDPALHDVVKLGQNRIAEILLKHGANPNHTSETDPPMLLRAICDRNVELIDLLLSAGANPEYDTENGIWNTVIEALPEDQAAADAIKRVFAKHRIL